MCLIPLFAHEHFILEYESPSKKYKTKKKQKKQKPAAEPVAVEPEPEVDVEDDESANTSIIKTGPSKATKKKKPQEDAGTSSDEERWLEAIETGKPMEEIDDELKKIKPKDPRLMTARQRAMYEKNISDSKDTSPTSTGRKAVSTIVDGVQANVSSSGQLLLALPNFKVKEKGKMPPTAEDIEKSKEKAQKRKQLADAKREHDRKKTMERLLKKGESKTVKATKVRIAKQQQAPVISYKNTIHGSTLSFPIDYEHPIQSKLPIEAPLPVLCAIPGCKEMKRYSCSKTNIPLCSLACYRKNVESVKQMIF